MGLFRRRAEPLHERLLRAGGYEPATARAETPPVPAAPAVLRPLDPLHGARPREWDTVVTAVAPGLPGGTLDFVVLEDGAIATEDELPEGSLDPLCDAVEQALRRPYRALAVRQEESLWAVSARSVELVQLRVEGEELDLTVTRAGRELVVDGAETFARVPELELRPRLPREFHAHATRIAGDRWELDVAPL